MGRQDDDITDEQIAAAELRLVIDDRLGRSTPSVIRRIVGDGGRPIGRPNLLGLIDELIMGGGPGVSSNSRPVLVVEGYAGSGRTTLLETVRSRWETVTPTAMLSASTLDRADDDIRPMITAIMFGLARAMPRHVVTFPRTLLAQIAMTDTERGVDREAASAELRQRLESYRHPGTLAGFVRDLAVAQAMNTAIPDAAAVAGWLADGLAGRTRFARWAKPAWDRAALPWFGHQDRGLRDDPMDALLQLGARAATASPAARHEVNALLVAALLADLRDSVAHLSRRVNAVVLIDDADTPAAIAFTRSLLEVRRAISSATPTGGPPDPLTVISTSDGTLAEVLDRRFSDLAGREGTRSDDVRLSGMWLRARLGDLSRDEVFDLADRYSHDFVAARAVYRLTHGHPEATTIVLSELSAEPRLVSHLDELLGQPGPEPGTTVEGYLLRRAVRGLSGPDRAGDHLLEALVTVSAARHLGEALTLSPVLPAGTDAMLFASSTLWSPEQTGGRRGPHPMIRYLGLRALASRTDAGPGWDGVFERLRAAAADRGDRAGELHHRRMLGQRAHVAAELATMFHELPAREWLEWFDDIVATPDPRSPHADVTQAADTVLGAITTLLDVVPALEDPVITEQAELTELGERARHSFWQLASHTADPRPVLRAWETIKAEVL